MEVAANKTAVCWWWEAVCWKRRRRRRVDHAQLLAWWQACVQQGMRGQLRRRQALSMRVACSVHFAVHVYLCMYDR